MRFVVALSLMISTAAAAQVPQQIGYQGRLMKSDGTPESGPVQMTFTLFDAPTAGTSKWTETQTVSINDGYYSVQLGSQTPLPASALIGGARYLEIAVGSGPLAPRQAVGSAPYALVANTVSGGAVDATTLTLSEDANLLPRATPKVVTLSNPAGDLGDQLKSLLTKNRHVAVTLAANTAWIWNKPVTLAPGQVLSVTGEGYVNGGGNITVTINMTVNRTITDKGIDNRAPRRMLVGTGSAFSLVGVNVIESAKDSKPLYLSSGEGALFVAYGDFCTIEVIQSHVTSSEDVISVGSRATANIKLGHTWFDKTSGSPRDIFATKLYTGWDCAGAHGFVHHSHTTLGAGVTYQPSPKLTYLDGNGLVLAADGSAAFSGGVSFGGGTSFKKIFTGIIGDCTANSAGSSGTVTFPSAFASPPVVHLTLSEEGDSMGCTSVRLTGRTVNGFTWNCWFGGNNAPCDCVQWMAIGN